MPKVSVIIPNYNHALYLERRIESVLNQTYQDFEVIILDDYSTDNSIEIIEKYRNNPLVSHIVFNEKNSGSTFRQWEKGINLAVGEYIWIAESDDWCESNLLEILLAKYQEYPNLGVVYCNSFFYDVKTGSKAKGHPHYKQKGDFYNIGINEIKKYLLYSNTIPNASAVVFRKNIYKKVNGANPNMKLCGDWQLWIKMLLISNVYFVDELLNYFQFSPNSVRKTTEIIEHFRERMLVVNDFVNTLKLSFFQKQQVMIAQIKFLVYLYPIHRNFISYKAWYVAINVLWRDNRISLKEFIFFLGMLLYMVFKQEIRYLVYE